jgi:hypothetical protein
MLMRSCWMVLALLASGGVARAQQAALPPPEPPETESTQRGRAPLQPSAAGAPRTAKVSQKAPAPAVVTAEAPAATSGEYVSVVHAVPDALPPHGDPLTIFPPAPPPALPPVQEKPPVAAPPPAAETAPPASTTTVPADASELATPTEPPAATPVSETPAAISSSPEPTARYDTPWSAAALVGVGATFDSTLAGVNPMGFGFGVRGDYRLLPEWAVGARMLYFVGGSVELPSSEVAMQSWLLAAEASYIWDLQTLLVQPGVALGLYMREANYRGIATFTEATASVAPDTLRPYFYLAPGVNVAVPLAQLTPALAPLNVGADARWDLAFGKRVSSNIQLLLQLGLRF